MNLNHTLMMPHVPTHAALGTRGVCRRPSRRALYNRAEVGFLTAQLPRRVITRRTAREGRAWRGREGEEV